MTKNELRALNQAHSALMSGIDAMSTTMVRRRGIVSREQSQF